MPVAEYFSERRMATCVKTFQQMYFSGPSNIQILSDESIEDKPLGELNKMYFDIITPNGNSSLPFLDLLVSFKMVVKYNKKQKKNAEDTNFSIKTIFEDHEAEALFDLIKKRIGIKTKSETV